MSSEALRVSEPWPELSFDAWADTHDTLHRWLRIAGKVKLRLRPFLNEWWHAGFHVSAAGLSTGSIPYAAGAFDVEFDFLTHNLQIRSTTGEQKLLPLYPRSVADFYAEFMGCLRALSIDIVIDTIPDEMPEKPADRIRLDRDDQHAAYDAGAVQRWWRILVSTQKVMDEYRSGFRGKSSPVMLWWGGMDISQTRFRGRPAPPPPGANRMMRLAEDEENIAAGFWPGNSGLHEMMFYSYAYPEPAGYKDAKLRPDAAHYHDGLREFVLPYEDLRQAADPDQALLDFFNSAYQVGADLGGWERTQLEQTPPLRDPFAAPSAAICPSSCEQNS